MKRHRASRSGIVFRSVALLILALLAVRTGSLAAQARAAAQRPTIESGRVFQVTAVHVGPSFEEEYEEYRRKVLEGLGKLPAPGTLRVYVLTSGGPLTTYLLLRPFDTFSDMEAFPTNADVLGRAFGETEARRLDKLRAGVRSVEIQMFRERPWLSTKVGPAMRPKAFAQLVRTEVKPEMRATYQWYLNALKQAQDKIQDQPPVARMDSLNGTYGTHLAFLEFDALGERDKWPSVTETIRGAYDEERAPKIEDAEGQSVARRVTWWLRLRMDLSLISPS